MLVDNSDSERFTQITVLAWGTESCDTVIGKSSIEQWGI